MHSKIKYLLLIIVYLLLVTVIAATGFWIYGRYAVPDKYEYWNNLIAKDPKPAGVSEEEYRAKLRAGFCWRDRKFYKPEELQQKAMVSFTGRLLGEAEAYRTDSTTLQGKTRYTGGQCRAYEEKKPCSVWLSIQGYTNAQWDKLFLAAENPADYKFLTQYMNQEIKQSEYLNGYLVGSGNKSFSLISRWADKEGADIYGSDCCRVMDRQMVTLLIGDGKDAWVTYSEFASTFPENDVPKDIDTHDYGVGNFYFEFREVIPMKRTEWGKNEKRTYQTQYPTILMMNNCGDILWQPYTSYEI